MRKCLSLWRGDVGRTSALTVGSPSVDRRDWRLKHIAFVLLFLMAGIGQVWGAVVSGTKYTTDPKTQNTPAGWTCDSYATDANFIKLLASTNYIQTDEFCQGGFTSIIINARKYGGPSAAQAVISVDWVETGGSTTTLGTVSPSGTSLANCTIPTPASVTANKQGYIKISCKGAGSSKGCGVGDVTINYTTGTCVAADPHTVSFSTGTGNPAVNAITETTGGAGITLPAGPTPDCSADGWSFAGWAEAAVAAETTTAPTLLVAGANYKPSDDVTLYAVYKKTETGEVEDLDKTEGFETKATSTTYNSTVTISESESDCGIGWSIYYGTVATNDKIAGNNSGQMRWYSNATSNLPYAKTTTAISGLQSVNFKARVSSTDVKMSLWYSTDGENWTPSDVKQVTFTAANTAYDFSATISGTIGTNYYVKIGEDGGTAPSSGNYKLIIDAVQFNYKAGASTTYYLSAPSCCEKHAITIANNIANGSVTADLSEACEGAVVTLTAAHDPSYHFDAWSVVDADENPITVDNEGKFTMPATAVTVSATFVHDECTNLAAPTLNGEITKDYKSATIAWNAVTDAVSYVLNVAEHDGDAVLTDASVTATSKELTGLKAATQYDYSVMAVGDGTEKCADGNALLQGSFTTDALPQYTLTLSENGETSTEDHGLNVLFDLPTSSSQVCSGKVFRGWSEDENADGPEDLISGQYSISADKTIYAVYAKETPGAATLTKLGSDATFADGDKLVIAAKGTNYAIYFENAGSAYVKNWEFEGDDPLLSELADSKKILTLIKSGNNWKFGDATNGYFYSSGSNNLEISTTNSSEFNSFSWNTTENAFTITKTDGRYLNCRTDLTTSSNVNLWRFNGTNTNNGSPFLNVYKYALGAATYSNYSTTCAAALATPTFSLNPAVDPVNDKYTEAINVVITNNAAEGTIYYTLDGTNPTSASPEYTGAIALDACGTTTIKAIAITNDNESAVASATYTLEMAIPTVSAEDPYTIEEAIAVLNSGCYNNEDVWVKGTVPSNGVAWYSNTGTYTLTMENGFKFYYFYAGANQTAFTENIIQAGDQLVAFGKLEKSGTTYRLAQGCYLVSRTEAPKTAIESSLENPISVAEALNYIDNAATYDLSDVYVKGVASEDPDNVGTFTIHDANVDNSFQLYKANLNSHEVAENDTIIALGNLTKYYSTYEMAEGGLIVEVKKYVAPVVEVIGVEIDETATVKAGKTVQLTATVLPANATNQNVTWSVKSGEDYADVSDAGVVTGKEVGEAVIEVKTEDGNFTATCTVTVTEGDHVYAYYNYEKVTATADITDGEYLIVYEGDANHAAVAFNGSLATLDATNNGIAVEIAEGKIEGTDALHAATFTIDATAGTLQSKSGQYIGKTENSNGLDADATTEYTNTFAINEGEAIITASGNCTLRYNYASDQLRFRYFKNGQRAIALYKKVGTDVAPKADPELAFDPESVTLKLGEDFTAPTLGYAEDFDGVASITYASSDEDVAEVVEATGEVTIKAVGEATITASFAGNENYKSGTASYTITVNAADAPDPVYYVKVTSAPADWSGEYLLVYEDGNTAYAWDGTDEANNGKTATISENKIAIPTGAAVITIAAVENGYTIQINGDKYLRDNGSGSNIRFAENEEEIATVDITIEDGWAKIMFSERCIRFNNQSGNNGMRFRNYAASSQQAVQLYKKEDTYTTVRKDLAPNAYYTMCLDQAVTDVQGASIWRVLSKAQNGTDVMLEEVTGTLDAGRPYIFYATADKLEVVYNGEAVDAPVTEGNNGLIGSFTQEPIAQSPNNFIIYNNALYYVNSDNVKVGAHRAYLDMTGVLAYSNEPQQGAPRRRVTMAVHGEQTTTGIDALNAAEAPVKVLINGQMYILRGEKQYDATGRLVK